MKTLLIGVFLGIFVQKAAVSIQWYSWMYYEKECRSIQPYEMVLSCVKEKQGILYYVGVMSGTITPQSSWLPEWTY